MFPLSWIVAPPVPARLAPAPGRRLAPIMDALAVTLLLLAVVAAAGRRIGRRRRRRFPVEPPPAHVEEEQLIPEVVS